MAISEDGSAPAVLTWTGAATGGQTCASFSPPANVVLLALVVLDGLATAATTGTVTDSLGAGVDGTWALLKRQNTQNGIAPGIGGSCEIWWKVQTSSHTGQTVTITQSATGAANGGLMSVKVLNGATSTQTGVTGGTFANSGTASAVAVAITPGASGNTVYGAVLNYTDSTALTVNANTTAGSTFADSTNGDWYSGLKSASTTTTSSTSYGYSTTKGAWQIAVAEIQAAAVLTSPPEVTMAPRIPT